MHWRQRSRLKTARAWRLKEGLREVFAGCSDAVSTDTLLTRWISWATHCRLAPFKRLGATTKKHLAGWDCRTHPRRPGQRLCRSHQRPCPSRQGTSQGVRHLCRSDHHELHRQRQAQARAEGPVAATGPLDQRVKINYRKPESQIGAKHIPYSGAARSFSPPGRRPWVGLRVTVGFRFAFAVDWHRSSGWGPTTKKSGWDCRTLPQRPVQRLCRSHQRSSPSGQGASQGLRHLRPSDHHEFNRQRQAQALAEEPVAAIGPLDRSTCKNQPEETRACPRLAQSASLIRAQPVRSLHPAEGRGWG